MNWPVLGVHELVNIGDSSTGQYWGFINWAIFGVHELANIEGSWTGQYHIITRSDIWPSDASHLVISLLACPLIPPCPAPPPLLSGCLPLPPLNIPLSSEAEISRFREFKTKALWTDRPTDGPTNGPMDGRTDRPSYRDAWTHLKTFSSFQRGCQLQMVNILQPRICNRKKDFHNAFHTATIDNIRGCGAFPTKNSHGLTFLVLTLEHVSWEMLVYFK